VSSTELNVVCRNCGEQVSPYVTECPYCGTRLRKRAPKLELRGDEITPRVSQ
jgi:rRNA maturation endonuclease Nob1